MEEEVIERERERMVVSNGEFESGCYYCSTTLKCTYGHTHTRCHVCVSLFFLWQC